MKSQGVVVALALITLLVAPFEMIARSAFAEDWQQSDASRAKIVVHPQESSHLDQAISKRLVGPSAVRQEAMYAQPCRRSQEVALVPLEDGNAGDVTVTSALPARPTPGSPEGKTRKVTITRC